MGYSGSNRKLDQAEILKATCCVRLYAPVLDAADVVYWWLPENLLLSRNALYTRPTIVYFVCESAGCDFN